MAKRTLFYIYPWRSMAIIQRDNELQPVRRPPTSSHVHLLRFALRGIAALTSCSFVKLYREAIVFFLSNYILKQFNINWRILQR